MIERSKGQYRSVSTLQRRTAALWWIMPIFSRKYYLLARICQVATCGTIGGSTATLHRLHELAGVKMRIVKRKGIAAGIAKFTTSNAAGNPRPANSLIRYPYQSGSASIAN